MNIVVLSRNTKLYSTRRLIEAAKERGHNAWVIDHTKCNIIIEGGKPRIQYNGEELSNIDAVIPRIGASVTFYGTAVVRQFEVMKVFCANGSQSIVRSRDKLRSLQIISQLGIGIPKTIFANHPKDNDVETIIKQLGKAPLIIKILEGTQGLGVVLAETQKAAKSVIEAFSGLKAEVLIQEFIKEAGGADIRAFVVDGKVVGAMKRQGKEGDFRSNLHRGGYATIIELTDEEQKAAIGAAEAMELKVAGVDILQSERGPLIIEVNSSPGLYGIETATKYDIAGEIISYIERNVEGSNKGEI
jgi:ribosomal protein S6--L-glutamate ligase